MPDAPGDVMLWLNDRLGRSVNPSVVVERGDLDVTVVVEGEGVLEHWTERSDARSLAVPRDDLAGAYRVGATDFDVTRLVDVQARLLDDGDRRFEVVLGDGVILRIIEQDDLTG